MNRTRIRTLISGAVAASALAVVAIGGVAQAAANDGLRNCVEITGPQSGRVGCYELVVSLNTLRTHTKNIYAKLGVSSRRAAIRRAEELGLL